jgi:hypothetical protein
MTHPTASRRRVTGMYRRAARTRTIYCVSDSLHAERAVHVPGHEIATAAARAIGEYLAVDVTVVV